MDRTDKELIELSAKAAGLSGEWELDEAYVQEKWRYMLPYHKHGLMASIEWNPLREDGDALRLAVQLGVFDGGKEFHRYRIVECLTGIGLEAATRRAIVRVAADIGSTMQDIRQPSLSTEAQNEQKGSEATNE